MTRKSKWTLEELESLTKIKNHKIMFDGCEYYWKRKLNEKWERHFILNFKTKEKAFSYLKYNISKWSQKE